MPDRRLPDRPFNVLFLCTGNSARSIMAEAILGKLGSGKFQAYSAGSQPKGQVHPETLRLLQSLDYNASAYRSKSWEEFAKPGATVRTGPGQWFAEGVATFGLLLTIFGCLARTPASIPYAVGLYITAAYWFTASTSFANPAVTIARALSDTFAGIAPGGVMAFIIAQFIGALAAVALGRWLWNGERHA